MASAEDVYRESQSRLHRVLGNYLAIHAWKTGADCVVIQRNELLTFLELQRMKNIRVDWIKEDLQHLFSFAKTTNYTDSGNYAELYLSRTNFPKDIFSVPMDTKERIKIFSTHSLKLVDVKLPKESDLISVMALAMAGISTL